MACQSEKNEDILIEGNLPGSKAEYQKTIVGQLSGKYPLANNTVIRSRWSESERELSKHYLKQLISTLGIDPIEQTYRSPNLNPAIDLILDPFEGTNIYGILPSTNNSSEYVILGGHYDSGKRKAPGAIDNATGIALIYSVVKELSKLPERKRNILIVFFDQEEEELIGSKAFGRFLMKNQWDIHSIHCFDMVGWDSDNDRAMEVFSGSEPLINAYKAAAAGRNIPVKDILIDTTGYDRNSTDFDAFVPMGFPVIGAGECFYHRDSTPYKDTPKDTYETVNFDYLVSCSDLVEHVIEKMVTD